MARMVSWAEAALVVIRAGAFIGQPPGLLGLNAFYEAVRLLTAIAGMGVLFAAGASRGATGAWGGAVNPRSGKSRRDTRAAESFALQGTLFAAPLIGLVPVSIVTSTYVEFGPTVIAAVG